MACELCGFTNPSGFQFCGQCGSRLGDSARAQAAERRQLTVMFFDLVGSTTLSAHLDPEELRDLIQLYQRECNRVVTRYQGHVAQYLGDGILVYFGYPMAHADDGARAVGAALAILEAMESLNQRLQPLGKPRLDLRVGIHTGLVVVGEIGSQERRENLALGETPNIAARLQGLAEINDVAFSEATFELIRDEFEVEDLGPQDLKGVPQPVRVYRPLGRLDRGRGPRHRSSEFAGRRAQLAALASRWAEARQGNSLAIQVYGEPGIGKSRFLEEFLESAQAPRSLTVRACPSENNVAWSSLVLLLRELLKTGNSAPLSAKTLESRLGSLIPNERLLEQSLPILVQLLGLDPLQSSKGPSLSPQAFRVQAFEICSVLFTEFSKQTPLLMVIHGGEWTDPTTVEWLRTLPRHFSGSQAQILLIFSSRSIVFDDWQAIEVNRLSPNEARTLVQNLATSQGTSLAEEIIDQIALQAQGVPYYLEELTLATCRKGQLKELPGRLQDFLGARLDQLGLAKLTAQRASVIGPRFSRRLLGILAEDPPREALETLRRERVAWCAQGRDEWYFSQTLMQEACYQSLLRSVRQEYHGRLAEALLEQFPIWAQQNPGVLAHHLELSSHPARAIPHLVQAATRSLASSALVEAVKSAQKGLEILDSLPVDHPAQAARVQLLTLEGSAWIGLRGYAAAEVENCFTQAYQICGHVPDSVEIFPVLAGLWVLYLVQGKLSLTDSLSQRLEAISSAPNHPLHRVSVATRGQSHFWQGRLAQARNSLEHAVQAYQPGVATGQTLAFLQTEPSIASASYLAYTYLLQDEMPETRRWLAQAREWAQQLNHPHTLAHTLCFESWILLTADLAQEARPVVEQLLTVAQEHAFLLWLANGKILSGLCQLWMNEPAGAQILQEGVEAGQATGAQLGITWSLAQLARVSLAMGDQARAEQLLAQATLLAEESGERWFLPEILRLQAALLSNPERSTLLEEARQLAMAQGARFFLQQISQGME